MASTKELSFEEKKPHKIDLPDAEIQIEFVRKIFENVKQFLTKRSCKTSIIHFIIVAVATIATIYVCKLSSQRYMHSWVQTVIESTDVHVSEISFPAVTICPIENFHRLRLYLTREKFIGFNDSTTDINDIDFELLARAFYQTTLFSLEDDPTSQRMNEDIEANSDYLSKFPWNVVNLEEFYSFMSYTCEELFEECTWRSVRINCCQIFKKIETYKGVCFSFNSILVENPPRSWPWKLSEAGIGTGLKVMLRKNITHQYFSKVAAMIHDPNESLSTDIIYMDGERIIAAVNPLRFTAEEDIDTLPPEYRHCYFMSELKLLGKSTSECIRDCRMNYIKHKCNCTYIFAKTAKIENSSFPICGPSHLKCIYQHRNALRTTGNFIEDRDDNNITTLDCRCYPNCNYIRYSAAVYSDNTGAIKNNLNINLQVYFQQETLFSYHSMLRYTLLDLLVAYGGIAGLFLGISLVGIVEALILCITCWKKRGEVKDQNAQEYLVKK